MKKLSILLALTSLFQFTLAQNRANYPVKEQYEKLHYDTKIPGVYDNEISPAFGDNYSFRLESMIRMYETTEDKAYLIKFANNY
jgi:hypothetical protein